MSFHPNDLVSDVDLKSYDQNVLKQFGAVSWLERRQKALEDWLYPALESNGFDPQRLRTRHEPVHCVVNSTNKTTEAQTASGLNLATLLASASDVLYVGADAPFRGIFVTMLDSLNSTVNAALSVACWTGAWTVPATVNDGTRAGAKVFGQGGSITWLLPDTLVRRSVANLGPAYWARLSVSASPTGAVAGPLYTIRRSRLCAAATLRTLALIYREAPAMQDGPWQDKAEWYDKEAKDALAQALPNIGPEFDTDDNDAIGDDEREQTAAEVSGGGWTLERG